MIFSFFEMHLYILKAICLATARTPPPPQLCSMFSEFTSLSSGETWNDSGCVSKSVEAVLQRKSAATLQSVIYWLLKNNYHT